MLRSGVKYAEQDSANTIYISKLRFQDTPIQPFEPKEVVFFKKCPYFTNSQCQSISWGPGSPCWKCFKEGKYNPQNAIENEMKTIIRNQCKCK